MKLAWTVEAAWFHGTDADLSPGDVLLPGADIGKSNFTYSDAPDHAHAVWVCDSEDGAGFYGGKVYEVEPYSPPQLVQAEWGEYRTDGARVLQRVSAQKTPAPHLAKPQPAPPGTVDKNGLSAQYVKPFVCAVCGQPIEHQRAGAWKHAKTA